MKITVIGIGQSLRGDDAAGLEAVRQWAEKYPKTACCPDIEVQTCEQPGLGLIDLFAESDAVLLVDATEKGANPGRVRRFSLDQLAVFSSNSKTSHGWGISETIKLDRHLHPERQNMVLRFIGIEAEQMNIGEPLSPAIRQALPLAGELIQKEISDLL